MAPAAAELAERLGLPFRDLLLLSQALVHSSHTHEHPTGGPSNERLEFLGDAVVGLIVSDELWRRHPDEDEGSLTTRRAAIVSARGLAGIAERLELGGYLVLGEGARLSRERTRDSVLAGAFEALTAAVYLDLGLELTRRWLLDVAAPEFEAAQSASAVKAPKSILQELSYARGGQPPDYRLIRQEGPPHDKRYVIEVVVGGEALGRGEGRSRRQAETAAASEALRRLRERGVAPGKPSLLRAP